MSLISTLDLRLWMGLEEGDKKPNVKLIAIAQAIEDFVDSYTNRKLEAARYNSDPSNTYYDGTGRRYLYVKQYPISYVYEVNVDSERTFGSGTLIPTADIFFYTSGKVVSEGGYFVSGRRNIKVDYIAGYAPVVGGTWNSSVSTYPVPADLKQTMVEMAVESFKEGMTAVHTVQSQQGDPRFIQMLSKNSFWSNVLNKYKSYDAMLQDRDEE